ncbi:hypothetical protein HY450_00945 [Candidatus Pacearchaeota archaeon]|nr:hypothetical protein [Candidatus Pacearchaeota archaeon]
METEINSTLVKEGKIFAEQGRLLVIDPCYLEDFDMSRIFQCEETRDIGRINTSLIIDEKLRQEAQNKVRARPHLRPPYIAEIDGHLVFRNNIGDGNYPIIRSEEGVRIVFNYPIRSGLLDRNRLGGKLIGFNNTESGVHVITNPEIVEITLGVKGSLYCVMQLSRGVYSCRFVNNNGELSIRRLK